MTLGRPTLAAIETWLTVRARENQPVEPSRFTIEAEHSIRGGLLGRLLDGKEPHEHPPPRAYSRPWYELVDAGGHEGPLEAWRLSGRQHELPDAIVISQSRWHLVETLGPDDYVIEWRDGGHEAPARLGGWRITKTGEPDERSRFARWHLRPHREGATP